MSKLIISKIFILFVSLVLASVAYCSENERFSAEINKMSADGKTILSIQGKKCHVGLEYFDDSYKFNKSVIMVRRDCRAGENIEMNYIRRLINHLADTNSGLAEIESIFWGGLNEDQSRRLSTAAIHSKRWKITSTRKYGNLNKSALDLINDSDVFNELKSIFSQQNFLIRAKSIEKVKLSTSSELGLTNEHNALMDEVEVPVQALVWFSLTAMN